MHATLGARSAARRRSSRGAAAALVIGIACALSVGPHDAAPARAAAQPTIVVIMTDDQRWDTLWAMPNVQAQLVGKGVTFENAFASNPLCCPSRASTLTGKYAHSTGVWRNQPPYGGWDSFDDSSTIATWLRDAGYTTGFFGKYLNRYWTPAYATGYVPPGWSRWVAFPRSEYYDYDLNIDGTIEHHSSDPSEYSTTVLSNDAASFIRDTPGPLLVWFTPYAPHNPATPGPGYETAFSRLDPWRPVSYDEPDVSDKPAWLRALPQLSRSKKNRVDAFRINQYRTLGTVDDAVGQILSALEQTGRLSTSLVVFMSDNGFSWGEHRWTTKRVAYEESLRIPMVVRYDPAVTVPRVDDRIVLNIDVAPTAADAAGVRTPNVDGTSLLPLLDNPSARWRTAMLADHFAKPSDRVPSYCGVRTDTYAYVYYSTGDDELYDLVADPYELTNVVDDQRMSAVALEARTLLKAMCNPAPPDMTLPFP